MKRIWKVAIVLALGLVPATVYAGVQATGGCPCGSECPCGKNCDCDHG